MIRASALLAVSVLIGIAWASPARAERKGLIDSAKTAMTTGKANDLYHQGRYEDARGGYMRAKDLAGESGDAGQRLHFNIGDTFYKEGNYEQAEKEFQLAAASEDPALREMAYYNLGNVNFQKAMQDQQMETLEQAVGYYQKALELNPDNQDAKFNIEVVRRLIDLKQQQQQQQPQACPNPKTGQGQEQQQPGQQRPQQQPDRQQKQEEGKEPSPASGSTVGAQQPKPEQVKPAGSEKPPGELSEEEAKRFLQTVQEQEKENLKQVIEAGRQRRSKDKDW